MRELGMPISNDGRVRAERAVYAAKDCVLVRSDFSIYNYLQGMGVAVPEYDPVLQEEDSPMYLKGVPSMQYYVNGARWKKGDKKNAVVVSVSLNPLYPAGSAAAELLYTGVSDTPSNLMLDLEKRYPDLLTPMASFQYEGRDLDKRALYLVLNDVGKLVDGGLATRDDDYGNGAVVMTDEQRRNVLDLWGRPGKKV